MAVSAELRAGTHRLTLLATGLTLGLSGALCLPLLLPWSGRLVVACLVALLALVPLLVSLSRPSH